MISHYICHSLREFFPNSTIDSCLSKSQDVLNSAMFLVGTVCLGFAFVASYKLYEYFNGNFFLHPKKTAQVMTKSSNEVLSIALHHGVNAEGQLFRLKRGTKLRLVPAASLLGRYVALYCNYPVTGTIVLSRVNSNFCDLFVSIQ